MRENYSSGLHVTLSSGIYLHLFLFPRRCEYDSSRSVFSFYLGVGVVGLLHCHVEMPIKINKINVLEYRNSNINTIECDGITIRMFV